MQNQFFDIENSKNYYEFLQKQIDLEIDFRFNPYISRCLQVFLGFPPGFFPRLIHDPPVVFFRFAMENR